MNREQADALDASDPLRRFRDEFVIADDETIYLDGNSLGRLPKRTVGELERVVTEEWAGGLVLSWDRWLHLGLRIGDELAPLIGAEPGSVAVCDQTSLNLYKLAASALGAGERTDIITDAGNFPSDRYILESVARDKGGRLRVVDEDPTAAEVEAELHDGVALVSLTHVSYRSGRILDMGGITQVTHRAGALSLWDLAHAAGSVPIDLAGHGVDLAIGCTYKYLNGGPGSPGFVYVRPGLQTLLRQPIEGWYAHSDQFGFHADFTPADDIRRFTVGTPSVLSMIGAQQGIAVTREAGIEAIREKSIALTTAFLAAIGDVVETTTPRDASQRGSHVTLRHDNAWQLCQALRDRNVIADFRSPSFIRFGFAPLYTTFGEVYRSAEILLDVIGSGTHLDYPKERASVT